MSKLKPSIVWTILPSYVLDAFFFDECNMLSANAQSNICSSHVKRLWRLSYCSCHAHLAPGSFVPGHLFDQTSQFGRAPPCKKMEVCYDLLRCAQDNSKALFCCVLSLDLFLKQIEALLLDVVYSTLHYHHFYTRKMFYININAVQDHLQRHYYSSHKKRSRCKCTTVHSILFVALLSS